jgi:hypothetical protein
MTKVQKVGYIVSGALLISSFFVKDNKKAVNRRWWAVGVFGGVWAYELISRKKIA